MEGTATWFGITDFKGRLKPSYYALKNAWLNEKNEAPLARNLYFRAGRQSFIEARTYKYQAVSENIKRDDLEYRWYLYSERNISMILVMPILLMAERKHW